MKKEDLRALFVTGFWSANFAYRGFMPAIPHGWDVSNEFIDNYDPNQGQKLAQKMRNVHVVSFHRPNHRAAVELMKLAKQLNKIVIFDDDDTFKMGEGIVAKNDEEQEYGEKVEKWRNEALRLSNGVTCTTEFLAEELRQINPNVCVLPNCIDPDDAGECDPNTTGRPRILIMGSVISNDDWHIARKAIEQVADRVTFVLLGVPEKGKYGSYDEDMKFWDSLPNVEKHGFTVFGNYYNQIQELACDLAIAPRADNYFNRCKSNLKFLEASLFALPFVGQAFSDGLSPYQVNPEDSKYLKLATTEDNWCTVLEEVLEYPLLTKEMGIQAQKYVTEEYSIYKHANKWLDFYHSLT